MLSLNKERKGLSRPFEKRNARIHPFFLSHLASLANAATSDTRLKIHTLTTDHI